MDLDALAAGIATGRATDDHGVLHDELAGRRVSVVPHPGQPSTEEIVANANANVDVDPVIGRRPEPDPPDRGRGGRSHPLIA